MQQQTGGYFLGRVTGHPHALPHPLCVCQATEHLSVGLNLGEEAAAAMAQNPEESPARSMYCIRLRRQASGMGTQWPTTGDLGTRWEGYECRWPLGPYASTPGALQGFL